MDKNDLRYLEALSYQYPSIAKASTEIINLTSILHLPKGTEHFISDVHGEYEQFATCKYMPKLNTSNLEVQEYLIGIATHYVKEYGEGIE